jgi:hypothetical protein
MKLAGISLLIIGLFCLVYQGLSFLPLGQDVETGRNGLRHQENDTRSFPFVVVGICMVGGVMAVATSAKDNT